MIKKPTNKQKIAELSFESPLKKNNEAKIGKVHKCVCMCTHTQSPIQSIECAKSKHLLSFTFAQHRWTEENRLLLWGVEASQGNFY
jgi:hypothetical protein